MTGGTATGGAVKAWFRLIFYLVLFGALGVGCMVSPFVFLYFAVQVVLSAVK